MLKWFFNNYLELDRLDYGDLEKNKIYFLELMNSAMRNFNYEILNNNWNYI